MRKRYLIFALALIFLAAYILFAGGGPGDDPDLQSVPAEIQPD